MAFSICSNRSICWKTGSQHSVPFEEDAGLDPPDITLLRTGFVMLAPTADAEIRPSETISSLGPVYEAGEAKWEDICGYEPT